MKFWAICDTDGGRHEPRPMARCIFTTEDAALSHRAYQGYPPLYYPIRQIDVKLGDEVVNHD